MNSRWWILAILAILSPAAYGAAPEAITAVQKCELGPCLLMEIDYPEEFVPKGKDAGGGYSIFELPVKGRFGDEPPASFMLSVKAYKDGSECSNLGQANIAVQGMKNAHPWIKTSRGNLEVIDDRLEVGCKDCIQRVDKKTGHAVASYTTPSRDLARLNIEAIYVDDKGGLWLKGQGGCRALLGFNENGEYGAAGDSYVCLRDGLHQLKGSGQLIQQRDETFHRYDIPSMPFYVDVVNQSCS